MTSKVTFKLETSNQLDINELKAFVTRRLERAFYVISNIEVVEETTLDKVFVDKEEKIVDNGVERRVENK